MQESYDPRATGPRATKTPHGLKMVCTDLAKLIERNKLHDKVWAGKALSLIKSAESGKQLPDASLAELEAWWLSMVQKRRLPSTAHIGSL